MYHYKEVENNEDYKTLFFFFTKKYCNYSSLAFLIRKMHPLIMETELKGRRATISKQTLGFVCVCVA